MLNLNKSDDIYYRYTMEPISYKLGGSGNGTYTIINNLDTIASNINCPNEVLIKYISQALGTNYTEKLMSIKGHHTNIQDIIFNFIDEFIICDNCKIPEQFYYLNKIKKKSILICKCSACGSINQIKQKNKLVEKTIEFIEKYLDKGKLWNSMIIQN